MPTPTDTKEELPTEDQGKTPVVPRTVIGWQGVRFTLPPEWNITGFSMDRDNGYLRVDAPGNSSMTVQIRWLNANQPTQSMPNLYTALAPKIRALMRRPEPALPKPDLKDNLERILKETAKSAKKAKFGFESSIKPEKSEGENGERTAMNFTWTGAGRGQGKIWHCAVCNRIVVAQVVGLAKDQSAMAGIASQVFASLHDHPKDGYDLWALYDLQMEVPSDFRLESQKLLSGYLRLVFMRGAERIVLDRWGLANVTLKKFTVDEWFRNNAMVNLGRYTRDDAEMGMGHTGSHYSGALSLNARVRALREGRFSLRRFPTRYEGGAWECPETNKLYTVQVSHSARSQGLWAEVVKRCVCH